MIKHYGAAFARSTFGKANSFGLFYAKENLSATTHRKCLSIQHLDAQRDGRERVVILGSGWAGYTLSRRLDSRRYQVVVVSPRSYFVFTPLLAGTSVGTLEYRVVMEQVRSARSKVELFQGWAHDVNFDQRALTVEEAVDDDLQNHGLPKDSQAEADSVESNDQQQQTKAKGATFDISWDKLIISVGCYSQTFSIPGVRQNAFFLKDVSDARKIRTRLLNCFEKAALPTTAEFVKRQLLNFAVVGGGPTGIEWAAELHDLAHEDMAKLYPDLIQYMKITVYDVSPTVLPMFDQKLSTYAKSIFQRQGISIQTSHHVEELRQGFPKHLEDTSRSTPEISAYTLKFKEEGEIGCGMVVWSTGLMSNPFVAGSLNGKVKKHDRSGGVLTNDRLQVKRYDDHIMQDVFAIGDCGVMESSSYPATAQVASQKAIWLAKRLNKGDIEKHDFQFKNMGTMAYLGSSNAILQSAGGDISGRMAWLIWRAVYLTKSLSWRNKLLIPIYWAINWAFGRDISRF
ncbi:Hypothetical protein R9X50_00248200 [Acrodontium crateriforme]|uniref:FAD/NAD(P)-binding domain-containing protein n=1 Tax=Acrodontium crateriforme TaxID=150365 RepID=A0AAQ3M1B5_9PEZI|nr:Hypothetical protein R9X50_00248200 [Acrodontium crateriforme]